MAGPLDGIRVVELAQWAAVPAAGAMLADWGAEVIHVEHPVRGDGMRGYLSAGISPESDVNYIWELENRNKKSLTIDLEQPLGREVMYKLIAAADVFASNLRPYELEKFALDYATLAKINPRLVFANVTGYGPKGPDGNSPGYDYSSFWARSGVMQMLTEAGTIPPGPRPGYGDHITSIAFASAILLGLVTRERTGIAQQVNVSLYHVGMWAMAMDIQAALVTGQDFPTRPRKETRNPLTTYYETKDKRWIMLTLLQSDRYWPQFCRAVEHPELEHDPRFNSFAGRMEHNRELIEIIDGIFTGKTKDEWKERLDGEGLIWSPVQTLTEVVNDPQAWANDCFVPFDHPEYGKITLLASPVKLSETPPSIRTRAPELGEHNEEILQQLGYDWQAIVALKEQGIIV